MQGVQPMPSARPSSGAPTRPRLPRTCGSNVRCAKPKRPMKTRPSRMIDDAEDARDGVGVLEEEASERSAEDRSPLMKTTVNPAMKRSTPPSSRPRPGDSTSAPAARGASIASPAATVPVAAHRRGRRRRRRLAGSVASTAPPMNPRYPGTSGSTHGERNERRPASDRDRDRDPQRAVGDDRARVHGSSRASRTRVVSTEASAAVR